MADHQSIAEDELNSLRKRIAQYEAWFRAIDANSKFDFWFKNSDSEYTYVNPHFAENMGRDVRDLQDVQPKDIFEPDRLERVVTLDEQVMRDGYLKRVIPCNSSGRMQMHEEHRFAVTDNKGEPIGLGCFAFEVTEKSLAEETLHQAEKIADLCSWRWSAGANLLVSCSEQMADFLGVSVTDAFQVFPNRAQELVLPEDRHVFGIVEDRIQGLSTDGYVIEYRMRRADGQLVHVREIAEPFSSSETTTEFLGVMQDITREKRVEAALRTANETLEAKVQKRTAQFQIAKEKAEAASKVKSQFLATMSHELRTPMNGVLGMTQVLQKTNLDDEQKGFLETIYNSGSALVSILNDILDFSKIEAGLIQLDPKPFSLSKAVHEVISLLSTTASEKGLALELNIQPDVPDNLIGDIGRIRQILMNLVGNAIKFTNQGHIAVNLSAVTEKDIAKLEIKVQDTGIGIREEKLGLIFDEFTQAEQSTTREYGGTGLGLAITRNIVNAMPDGRISVESELGRGTTFTVNLGLEVAQSGDNVIKNSALNDKTVLIVTPSESRALILRSNLQDWGAKPIVAIRAKDALELLQNAKLQGDDIDLIISDFDLGQHTGLDLARAIGRSKAVSRTKVILLSSGERTDSACQNRHLHVFKTDLALTNIRQLESLFRKSLHPRNELSVSTESPPATRNLAAS
ncbi:MAG: ATP-binding protein [Hyphomonadaceae bacterium]